MTGYQNIGAFESSGSDIGALEAQQVALGVGNAAGTGTAAAVGAPAVQGVAASNGTSTADGRGSSVAEAQGTAAGLTTEVRGVGRSTSEGVGNAAGVGAAAAGSSPDSESPGSAQGTGSAAGVGESEAPSDGSSDGEGVALGVGATVSESGGSAGGSSSAGAGGSSEAEGTGSSSGSGTGVGVGPHDEVGDGSAAGHSTATAVGASVRVGAGSAAGTSTALAVPHFLKIQPDFIPSTTVVFAPTLKGGTKLIIPEFIGPSSQVFEPTITGGVDSLQFYVGNYNRTRWARRGTANFSSQSRGRWSGSIEFENVPAGDMTLLDTDLEWRPREKQTILCKEGGRTMFRGCIRSIKARRFPGTDLVVYTCSLGDKAVICDKRLVLRAYDPSLEDWDMADVVRDVVLTYLNGEGLTLDASFPEEFGALASLTQPYISVTQLFDFIAGELGLEWYVNVNQKIVFVDPEEATAAPFEITESARNWYDLEVTEDDVDYRNREYVVSNRKADPSRTESYTLERWGDRPDPGGGISPYDANGGFQIEAYRDGYPPYTIKTEFPIASIVSAKIYLAAAPLVAVDAICKPASGITTGDITQRDAGLAHVWSFDAPGQQYIFAPDYSRTHPPLNDPGDRIELVYIPSTVAGAVAEAPVFEIVPPLDYPVGEQFGTCGSGRVDHVTQVNDVDTAEGLHAIAAAALERFGQIGKTLRFTTHLPGLEVGQLLHADLPRNLLEDEDLFISELSWTEESSGMDLGRGTAGRYHVTANSSRRSNWIKVWENLWRRTQHPQPQDTVTGATIIFPGTVLEGTNITAPGKIVHTGRLSRIVARFNLPPVGQTLVLDILVNGVSILDSVQLRVPEGTTGDVLVEVFATDQVWVYRDQTVLVNARYISTGGAVTTNARSGVVSIQVVS